MKLLALIGLVSANPVSWFLDHVTSRDKSAVKTFFFKFKETWFFAEVKVLTHNKCAEQGGPAQTACERECVDNYKGIEV